MEFTPARPVRLDVAPGEHFHAIFLELISRVDPKLAGDLHGPAVSKPFTVSSILGYEGGRDITLSPGVDYRVRFTVFAPQVEESLVTSFLDADLRTLRLGRAEVRLLRVLTDSSHGLLCDYTSYEQLVEEGRRGRETEFSLEFISPTTLRRKSRNLPLPDPQILFTGYLKRWNDYSGQPFPEGLLDYVEAGLVISRHHLETRVFYLPKAMQIGFVGRVHFRILGLEGPEAAALRTLARFAYYCGSGYKSTMGMGQTIFHARTPGRQAASVEGEPAQIIYRE